MPKLFDADHEKFYFITVLERLNVDDNGLADTGNMRCWGFYKEKDTAFQAIHENWTDMQETIYNYAVIEEYHEGISHPTGFRQFFKYDRDKDGYVEIDEPTGYEHYCCFSIG